MEIFPSEALVSGVFLIVTSMSKTKQLVNLIYYSGKTLYF